MVGNQVELLFPACRALPRLYDPAMEPFFLDGPQEIATRWYQPFVVLSCCRMLHTLATGRIASKPAGVAWASGHLPSCWNALIRRAWAERPDSWRKVHLPADPDEVRLTLAFVRYAIERGERAEPGVTP